MTSTEQNLTPYDTGERLEPMPWIDSSAVRQYPIRATDPFHENRYGKVDFDTEESHTAVTAWVERDPLNRDGYVLRYCTHLSGIRVEEVTK